MLKHSIYAMVLVGLVTSAAPAIDLVWEPTDLIVGEPTTVSIYMQGNGSELGVGGAIFALGTGNGEPLPAVIPDGGLFFDLDGPDNTSNTADDGWVWQNSIGTSDFITTIIQPESTWNGADGASTFRVPADGRILMATLEVTGTSDGAFRLDLGETLLFDDNFNEPAFKEGLAPVFNVAVPEPATMALLAIGGLGVLRRRRK